MTLATLQFWGGYIETITHHTWYLEKEIQQRELPYIVIIFLFIFLSQHMFVCEHVYFSVCVSLLCLSLSHTCKHTNMITQTQPYVHFSAF